MEQGRRQVSTVRVERDRCGICGCCVPVCPSGALILHDNFLEVVSAACTGCQKCVVVCPTFALIEVGAVAIPGEVGG